jgi:hypothetical protein
MEPAHRGIPAHLIPIRSRLPLEEEMASADEQPDVSPDEAARIAREAAMMEEADVDAEASETATNSQPGQRR